jgi:cell wall-associated NlpC family hydrolase
MIRLTLLISYMLFWIGCAIQPSPRYTIDDRPPRKENKNFSDGNDTNQDITNHDLNDNEVRLRFANEIRSFIGAPYVWGGATPAGTDCSGLVQTVYRDALGITLPHSTNELYNMGHSISKTNLQTGDLIFFRQEGSSQLSHVGIYLNEGKFVHASLSSGVTIDSIEDDYYDNIFLGARRIISDAQASE